MSVKSDMLILVSASFLLFRRRQGDVLLSVELYDWLESRADIWRPRKLSRELCISWTKTFLHKVEVVYYTAGFWNRQTVAEASSLFRKKLLKTILSVGDVYKLFIGRMASVTPESGLIIDRLGGNSIETQRPNCMRTLHSAVVCSAMTIVKARMNGRQTKRLGSSVLIKTLCYKQLFVERSISQMSTH